MFILVLFFSKKNKQEVSFFLNESIFCITKILFQRNLKGIVHALIWNMPYRFVVMKVKNFKQRISKQ